MLFWLSQYLSADYSFLNAFNYITLRSVLAILTAAILSLLVGNKVIDWLKAKKIGQAVRDDGPQTHLKKDGTPTMGGILILLSIAFSCIISLFYLKLLFMTTQIFIVVLPYFLCIAAFHPGFSF